MDFALRTTAQEKRTKKYQIKYKIQYTLYVYDYYIIKLLWFYKTLNNSFTLPTQLQTRRKNP